MAPSAHLKTLCLGILLVSAAEAARVKRAAANGACQPIPAPKNGKIKCADDGFDYTCTATCNQNYEFKTKEASVSRGCDQFDGKWYDGRNFPECQPVCSLGCLNGGSCVEPDKCACVDGWRGSHCQHHGSLCNKPPGPKFGSIQCTTDATSTVCTVACIPTFNFRRAPAAKYTCTPDGKWSPPKESIPDCIPGPAIQPTGSTVHHTLTGEATCVAWSQDHYRTFDNKIYTFQGGCRYLLTKDCAFNTFDIHVINDGGCKAGNQCKRELDIYMGTTTVSLRQGISGPEVTWNNDTVTIPGSRDGVVFEKIGSYIRVSSSLGFKVKWDGKESIFVQVSDDLKGKTCGLCGHYDGDPSNDFETDAGKVVTSAASFGNSWKKTSLDAANCPDASQQSTCKTDTPENSQKTAKAKTQCEQLLSDTAFSACKAVVDPTPYIEACKTDCCASGLDNCMCNTFEAYSRECMQKKVKLSWRKTDRCPVACQGGMVYKECGSACQRKCQDSSATCNDDTCVDGCFCPDGTVQHDGQCISPASCPCEHNGKEFTQGGTIPKDCNTCTCKSGKWECTTKKCEATCSATGDPHYMTFDGKRFNFMGTCSYYLIQDPNFDIIVDNIKCGHGEASCTKSVTLDVNGQTIKLDHNHQLFVNGKEITKLPFKGKGIKIFMVSSLFMQAELDNGIKILWDGRTRAYITAPPAFMQKTKGLCGYFDGNQNNDFLTKEGDIETNTNAFGNRWKTEATCRDMPTTPQVHPCDLNAQRKVKATTECEKLKSDTFKACHSVVDVDEFYEDCLYDTCACTENLKDCMCPNFGEYADTCASKGITINWRFEITECALQCTGGQEYQVCGSPCARTCRNIAEHESCQERCVEGCNCPKGQTLNDDGECVHIDQCPCVFDNREYAAGYTTIKGDELCQCAGAKWQCQSLITKDGSSVLPTDKPIQSLCEENKIYTKCISTCPVTCDNVHDPPTCTTTDCEPGCVCKPGFVKEGDRCVESTQCPCHHGGKAFFENEKIVMDCNECTCKSRKWECEMKDCPAICSTYGDSHYTTFDGKPFEFQGNCDYVLAKSTDTNSVKFQITTENIPCGTSGVTCTKAIEFTVGEPGEANFYRLNLVRGKPIINEPGSPFHIKEVGNYIYINTTFGITMQWDKGTTAYIRLGTQHRNKVAGLCGNFNGDQKDDFQMPQGGPPAVKATTFGDSWKVHDYCAASTLITDTCEAAPHRKPWAQKKCGIMQSDLFEPCHHVVPYQSYLDKCIFDACACDLGGDCECLCTAIAAYAHECAVQGVPIHWRSNELCAIECTDCSAYNPCISTCPKKTCDNRLIYAEVTKDCKQDLCFEGCDVQPCPPGQVFDGETIPMKCIPEPFCNTTSCILNGKEYREGERIVDETICRSECEICTCTNGELKRMGYCTGSTPFVAVPSGHPTMSPTAHPVSSGGITPTSKTQGPTVLPPLCMRSGWTAWMSSSTPTHANLGDIETIDGLRKTYSFCGQDMMTAIECRVIGQNTKAELSGQKVTCDLREGLKCYHKDQTGGMCLDYEVRYNCDCSIIPSASPTFGPGGHPTASPTGTGPNGNPTAVPPGGYVSGSPTAGPPGQHGGNPTASPTGSGPYGNPTASPTGTGPSGNPTAVPPGGYVSGSPTAGPPGQHGGNPTASPTGSGPYGNPTASPTGTGPSGSPTAVPPGGYVSGSPTAGPPGQHGGNPTASPTGTGPYGNPTASPTGTGPSGNPTAVPPGGYVSGSPTAGPPGQHGGNPTASPTGSGPYGNPTASPTGTGPSGSPTAVPPGGYVSGSPTAGPPGQHGGNPTASPTGSGPYGNPTASPTGTGPNGGQPTASPTGSAPHGHPTAVPPGTMKCTHTGWSSWMNTDKPNGDGDTESLQEIQKVHPICDQVDITYIQCRKAGTGESYEKTGDVNTVCTTMAGFMCLNSNQPDGQCEDYEIRVYCSCSPTLCTEKLMQELDYVKDSQFSSSTTNGETQEYAASNARMGGEKTWKPETTDTKPWVQVDFGEPVSVAGITTAGNTKHSEWITSYHVMMGDSNCDKFEYMKGPDGQPETFQGNTDASTPVTHMFRQKTEAVKCIRILPLTSHGAASLQFEVLGCRDFLTTVMPPGGVSGSPTASPTGTGPNGYPTAVPPHGQVSGSPTAGPNGSKDGNPTASPTGTGPNGNPTAVPPQGQVSGSPTAGPTGNKNGNPTASPTGTGPSGNPTAVPPHGQVSGSPTAGPNGSKDGNPTASPTGTGPSGNPTAVPPKGQVSGSPTAGPNGSKNGNPTASPTGTGPSGNPTAVPPHGQVSGSPTAGPNGSKDGNPTASPTGTGPSGNPTAVPPKGQVSGSPTAGPNGSKDGNPTASPTGTGPNGNPTAVPPKGQVSGSPTASPGSVSGGLPTTVSSNIMTKVPFTCKQDWSSWMNVDRPSISHSFEFAGQGDHENLDALRYYYSFCAQPSSIMCRSATTGKMYHMTDDKETVCNIQQGFSCVNSKQSNGKCDDYEVSVFCDCGGSPTAVPTAEPTFAPGITPPQTGQPYPSVPSCMWTPWMNSYEKKPGTDGDYETISNLRLKYPFCEKPVAIQCRAKPTTEHPDGIPYDKAGEMGVSCNLNRGLVCVDSMQPNGQSCVDYEVRMYCTDLCPPTTAPTETPTAEPPKSETGFPTAGPDLGISGKPTASPPSGTGISGNPTAVPPQGQVSGSPTAGPTGKEGGNPTASPTGTGPNGNPTAVPPHGQVSGSPTAGPTGKEGGNPTASPTGTGPNGNPTAVPPKGQVSGSPTAGPTGKEGGNPTASPTGTGPNGNPTAVPLHGQVSGNPTAGPTGKEGGNPTASPTGTGPNGNPTAVPPHGQVSGSPTAGPTGKEGGNPTASPTGTGPNGNPTAVPAQGQVSGNPTAGPTGNQGGNPTASPTGTGPNGNPTASPPSGKVSGSPTAVPPGVSGIPSLETCREGWTGWINTDKPNTGNGDVETVSGITGYPKTCMKVLTAECRVAATKADYKSTGQQVTCDNSGLECINGNSQLCADYEVRFYCYCGEQTTIPGEIPTGVPHGNPTASPVPGVSGQPEAVVCNHGWTPMMNEGHPTDSLGGDLETIEKLRAANKFCDESNIIAIDCVVSGTDTSYEKTGQQVTCEKNVGLICFNAHQSDKSCLDYSVRFFCDCAHSTPYNQVLTTFGVHQGSNGATSPQVIITTGSPVPGVSGSPTASPPGSGTNGGQPTASPTGAGPHGNPTASPTGTGVNGNPTASPTGTGPNGKQPTASPTGTGPHGNPTASPTGTGPNGNPTASPTGTGVNGNPTASPTGTGPNGNPTASPTGTGVSGNPTAGPTGTGTNGKQPTASPTGTGPHGNPTASPTGTGVSGNPTAGPTGTGPNGKQPTASPTGTGPHGNPTASPTGTGVSGNPTASPTGNGPNGGQPTASPTGTGPNGNPTASPTGTGVNGNPTASPTGTRPNGGQPTASPTGSSSHGNPTAIPPAQSTTCVSYWSDWYNRDKPTTGGGDYEHVSPEELRTKFGFCTGGEITKIECFGLDTQASSYSTGEMQQCDLKKGFSCNNVDNAPVNCQDYKIKYFCQMCAPTVSPPVGQSGHPTPGPDVVHPSGSPTAQPPSGSSGKPTPSPGFGVDNSPSPMPHTYNALVTKTTAIYTWTTTENIFHVSKQACEIPMGTGNHALFGKDQFTASTSFDFSFEAHRGRLETTPEGNLAGAWMPRNSDRNQWIQVDLKHPEFISGVVTQGRPDMDNWVTKYAVSTSIDGTDFTPYTQSGETAAAVFTGNSDRNTQVKGLFDHEILARYVRIHPVEWVGMIALRFDILSCTGLTSGPATNVPVGSGTGKPTASPGPGSNVSPTAIPPNGQVSGSPTASPGSQVSGSPTASPPGSQVSGNPTAGPTGNQGGNPTSSPPGTGPNGHPTAQPPKGQVSGSPTAGPTGNQGGNPTSSPPGTGPNGHPTAQPPKGQVSGSPTAGPTENQGGNPTVGPPGTGPNGHPTAQPPKGQVSGSPTAGPTENQGGNPTSSPPGTGPNGHPTAQPPKGQVSGSPTAGPTENQGGNPTVGPPGTGPNGHPTAVPPGTNLSPGVVCSLPMGVDNALIVKDNQFTSSGFSESRFNAPAGRLFNEFGAWSPKVVNGDQWIVVNFLKPQVINGILTQGSPITDKWVTKYVISYSIDGFHYLPITDSATGKAKIFTGNSDRNSVMKNIFPETITAQYIKIMPVEWSPAGIAMRFNVIGCYKPATEVAPTTGPEGKPTASPGHINTGGVPTATPPIVSTLEPLCAKPMGVENYRIVAESQLTSSSEKDKQHTAASARISQGTTSFSGAWVPATTDKAPWIQVDFLEVKSISGVITQGSGKDNSWTKTYTVSYSYDGKTFTPYSDHSGQPAKKFTGNTDAITLLPNLFNRNIYARFIRISPVSSSGLTSLRFNVIGCNPSPVNPSIPTVSPDLSHGVSPTASPPSGQTGVPTSVPSTSCTTSKWTPWINTDKPEVGKGDFEKITPQQEKEYCSGGKLTKIECMTTDGIEYFSSGEQMKCTLETGSSCKNEDNFPIPCSDYKIRYFCECLAPTPGPNTGNSALPTASPLPGESGQPTASPLPGESGHPTAVPPTAEHTPPSVCLIPMGIENSYIIGNSQLSASSSLDDKHTAAFGRLFGARGAWIPKTTEKPWIQVNFLQPTLISGVMTQGSPDVPKWVTKYHVYFGVSDRDLLPYTDIPGETTPKVFSGNTDQTSPVRNLFNRNIIAQYIRIIPVEWSKDGIAMRFNILGCRRPEPLYQLPTASPPVGTEGKPTVSPPVGASGSPTASPGQTGGKPTVSPPTGASGSPTASPGQTGGKPTVSPPVGASGSPTASPGQTGGKPTVSPPVGASGSPTASPGQTGGNPTASPPHIDHGLPTFTPPSGSSLNPTAVPPSSQSTPDYSNKCDIPMGIENPGIIGGRQLSASSILKEFTGAERARPYTQKDGYYAGGWIPKYNDKKQWIQVDFGASYRIAGVSTQGRSDAPTWVTKYEVYYSNDGHNFNPIYTSPTDTVPRVFSGNFDQSTPIMNVFSEISARFVRIRPVEWHEAIGLRFNVFGCQLPSPTPSVETITKVPIIEPSGSPHLNPTVTVAPSTASCMYWTPWVTTKTPDTNGEYESYWDVMNIVKVCESMYVKKIECRTVNSKIPFDQTGEQGVTCGLDTKALVCMNTDQTGGKTCSDYELRFFCDECGKPTSSPGLPHGNLPTAAPKTCDNKWSDWINRHVPDSVGETETVTKEDLDKHCPGGTVAEVECDTVADKMAYYMTADVLTCDAQTGLVCKNVDNAPLKCHDYMIRFKCKCESQPTVSPPPGQNQYPTGAPGSTCTASKWTPWINQDKPTAGGGDYEKITPEQEAQYCSGGKLTKVECETDAGIKYYSSGEVMQCTVAGGSSCNNADNFPVPCSDYKIRYYCECQAQPTASPHTHQPDLTASPGIGHTGSPTASPQSQCSISQWSSWINRDKPESGEGDFESMTAQEVAKFCPGGEITEVKCKTTDDIPSYSSGELLTCDKAQGLICKNSENFPVPCSDYMIKYYCKCSPTASPPTGQGHPTPGSSLHSTVRPGIHQGGTPTASPGTGVSKEPTAEPSKGQGVPTSSPVVTTCSQSHFSNWVNRDLPDTGKGDHEAMTPDELAAFCVGGKVTKAECYTGDIPSYSSGELMTCDVENGAVCNNADNAPVPCSDYKIRYFCDCSGAPQPVTTTAPDKKYSIHCDWSPWINTGTPETGHGDMETIDAIKTRHGVCKEMKKIECRVAGTNIMSSASGQSRVTCDINNGLRCFNNEQLSKKCLDYEVRVLCWDNTCAGTMPTAGPTGEPQKTPTSSPHLSHGSTVVPLERTTTAVCPPGEMWNACAYKCDEVCNALSGDICDGSNPQQCVPGCKDQALTVPKCSNGEKLSYTGQCVKTELCPCKKPDGSIAHAFEYFTNPTDQCSKCHCFNNTIDCQKDSHCTPTVGPTVVPTVHPRCDWTNWINVDKPTTGDGDIESLLKIRASHTICAHPVSIECRETSTKTAAMSYGEKVSCDIVNGFRCFSWENNGKCSDYEVRFYCPCTPTASPNTGHGGPTASPGTHIGKPTVGPTTKTGGEPTSAPSTGVSGSPTASPPFCGWSAWTNSDHPSITNPNKPFEGDIESIASLMTKTPVCGHNMMKKVECRVAGTQQPASATGQVVTCDTMRGLRCDNSKQGQNGKCLDYELRVFCDCSQLPTAQPGHVSTKEPTAGPYVSSGVPTAGPDTHISGMPTAAPNGCGWTGWMNSHRPDNTGEMELLTTLRKQFQFCKNDDITALECRNSITHEPALESGQVDVICDMRYSGLMCSNSKQMATGGKCYDYEVRVLCEPKGVDCSKMPTASPTGTGPNGHPTAVPHGHVSGSPTAGPTGNQGGNPTSSPPGTGPNGHPTAQPPKGQVSGSPTAGPTGNQGGNPTSSPPGTGPNGHPTAEPPHGQVSGSPTAGPTGNQGGNPTAGPPGTGPKGNPTAQPPKGQVSGSPTAGPTENQGGNPTAGPPGTGPKGNPTAEPPHGQVSGSPTAGPTGNQGGNPTAGPPGTGPKGNPTAEPPHGQVSGSPTAGPTGTGPKGNPTAVPPKGQVSGSPTAGPTGRYEGSPTAGPPGTGPNGHPTAQPPQMTTCAAYWSEWINTDKPGTGGGDFEHVSPSELASKYNFCEGGQVTKIDCYGAEMDAEYYSTGDVNECDLQKGLLCRNADNFPVTCQDYKIRYFCEVCAPVLTKSSSVAPDKATTAGAGVPTTPVLVCPNPMTNTASLNVPDHYLTASSSLSAYAGPQRSRIDAISDKVYTGAWMPKTMDKNQWIEARFDHPEYVNALITKGREGSAQWVKSFLVAYSLDGKNFKYYEETPGTPKLFQGNFDGDSQVRSVIQPIIAKYVRIQPMSWEGAIALRFSVIGCRAPEQVLPTASPSSGTEGHPTAAPQKTCATSTWSKWINRNTNPDGDYESMTKEEIAAFCPAGKMDKVECITVDDIPSYSTGEQMQCTVAKGLVCNNMDNFPIPCSDYKIRYHCKCTESPTASPGHTGSQEPTAGPGHTGGQGPTASPTQTGGGVPTASPAVLTAMTTPNIPSACKEEMGMKNGLIRNDMITASSYRDGRHSPTAARLGGSSSWLAAIEDKKQYIQVNFLAPRIITGITTQGRPDAPSYVTSFKVFYSFDGTNWSPYSETKGEDKVFAGNFDNVIPVTNMFMTPVRAQYIRINPQTWSQMISMRFEIHGCFESYPTLMPPSVSTKSPTASPPNQHGLNPTAVPPGAQTVTPFLPVDCVIWDHWIDLYQVDLTSNGDREPIDEVKKATSTCKQPMSIECRTATRDHTASDKTGQKVSCNLWEGLLCKNDEQKEPLCFNYEVRLGCLKQTPECLAKIPTGSPTGSPQINPTFNPNIIPCYTGMDLSRCPKDGCATGQFCDGLKCVPKSECPCLIEGHVVLPGQISQNSYCDTCQCVGGEVKCLPKTCPACQGGLSAILDKSTCQCECQACAAHEYKCGNGQCIPQAARCDGVADCTTDEFECMSTPLFTMPGVPTPKPTLPGLGTPTASPHFNNINPSLRTVTPTTETFVPTTGHHGNDLFTTRPKEVTTGIVPNATRGLPPHGPTPVACVKVTCPPLVPPPLKHGEVAKIVKTDDGCCEGYLVVCEPQQCPAISIECMKPEVLTRSVTGGDRCCPEYTCECPSKCPVPTEPPCAYGSQVVEIVTGCNCTTKACVVGIPVPVTTTLPPPICRYMATKKVVNGAEVNIHTSNEIVYSIGDTWSDGLCKTCECVNSSHGTPETSCKQQQCPACKLGEERRSKANSCCGECVQTGCIVKGKVYKAGMKIQSSQKCFEMMCTKDVFTGDFILQQTQVQCEQLEKLPKCADGEERYDASGCCLRCVPPTMLPTNSSSVCQSCTPRLMFGQPQQSINFFKVKDNGEDCANVDPIPDLKECSGYCGSTSSYTSIMRGFDNKCLCCQPATTVTKTVELLCSGGRKIKKTYNVPETCGCSACAGGR